MRDNYSEFASRGVEILAVGTDSTSSFQAYWKKENIPYIGLPDPKHIVADIYRQEVNLLKLGRMPALMLLDKKGQVRYQHYSSSMADIPENSLILAFLDKINKE